MEASLSAIFDEWAEGPGQEGGMMGMVERVARAMNTYADEMHYRPPYTGKATYHVCRVTGEKRDGLERTGIKFSSFLECRKKVDELNARIAIEAMREPTPEMEAAFFKAGAKRTNFRLRWRAAIGAALQAWGAP